LVDALREADAILDINKETAKSSRKPSMLPRFLRQLGSAEAQDNCSLASGEIAACYVFTIKKSGTHLLRNLLVQLGMSCIDRLDYTDPQIIEPAPRGQGGFVLSHQFPSRRWRARCQTEEAKIIMNLRDPRAVFLSLLDFYDWSRPLSSSGMHTVEFRRAACRAAFKNREDLGIALLEDEVIDDDPFTPWANLRRSRTLFHHPSVLKVRYEDFFQKDAGESVVLRVCRYLGQEEPEDSENLLRDVLAAPSPTKNVSAPDRWRTHLSSRLLAAFMERHGELVRDYGYPID
jgi:hypothetical protein